MGSFPCDNQTPRRRWQQGLVLWKRAQVKCFAPTWFSRHWGSTILSPRCHVPEMEARRGRSRVRSGLTCRQRIPSSARSVALTQVNCLSTEVPRRLPNREKPFGATQPKDSSRMSSSGPAQQTMGGTGQSLDPSRYRSSALLRPRGHCVSLEQEDGWPAMRPTTRLIPPSASIVDRLS